MTATVLSLDIQQDVEPVERSKDMVVAVFRTIFAQPDAAAVAASHP